MNGLNIQLFKFEYDLTWMAFFMDADDHFYARYGGRDGLDAETCLSKESLVRVMEQTLELHRLGLVQASRYEPAAEPARTPEDIPTMNAMIARRKENKCIHCHDVKVAELRHRQSENRFARDMVFTYPMPSAIGLKMDSREQNRVASVIAGSPAAQAGIQSGDVFTSVDGQRILTQADLARVLELTPPSATLPAEIQRQGNAVRVNLKLSGDWRRGVEPTWRESLHVAGPGGGFWGQRLGNSERRPLGIAEDAMAVKVTFIWADPTRKSGLQVGDIVVEFDGHRDDWLINQIHGHLHLHRNYADTVPLTVQRGSETKMLKLKLPDRPPAE